MNPKRSKSRNGGKLPMVHPNAAAIDVGATMHMAAVRADRAPEPVRSFGTFTADIHRLVDWFTECDVETVVIEIDQRLLDSDFRASRCPGIYRVSCQRARCQARAGAQDRCQRCAMAAAAPFIRVAAGQLSAQRADRRAASLRASARASAGVRGLTHPAYAEGLDGDESSAAPRRRRHHRRDRPAYHTRDHCRRARS